MALSRSRDNSSPAPLPSPNSPTSPASPSGHTRTRGSSGASGRLRSASLKFLDSNPPSGMWYATGEAVAKAPSLAEIRQGSFDVNGWNGEGQRRNSMNSDKRRSLSMTSSTQSPAVDAHKEQKRPLASLPPAAPFEDIQEDNGDFPEGIFGRGEMADQSYVKGPKKAAKVLDLDASLDDDLDGTIRRPVRSEKSKNILGESTRVSSTSELAAPKPTLDDNGTYPNGYRFPPKHTWSQATVIGLKAFWKFTLTPLGFLIVLYGLNVVAWGGMLFLLLIGGAPRMCYPAKLHGIKDCNNIDAPRRIWIETDSQILNALFCVTGFGLAPWRFRDLYYLLKFRVRKNPDGLRKLAGIHRGWFRLPGSDTLPPTLTISKDDAPPAYSEYTASLPLPISKTPDPPLTGVRAPPTPLWKLDYVIWAYVANTFLQCVLSGFMWGLNRYDRPSWSTGLFVALACIVAALGGLMAFQEGKKVKRVEGVPPEVEEVTKDAEKGVGEKEKKGKGPG